MSACQAAQSATPRANVAGTVAAATHTTLGFHARVHSAEYGLTPVLKKRRQVSPHCVAAVSASYGAATSDAAAAAAGASTASVAMPRRALIASMWRLVVAVCAEDGVSRAPGTLLVVLSGVLVALPGVALHPARP